MKKIFLTQTYNKAGIFALKVFIRGKETTVVVDDFLPYYGATGNDLLFDSVNQGEGIWAAVLEKAWAKVNGNYENINYGWQVESFYALTGAPGKQLQFTSVGGNAGTIWNEVTTALKSNFLVGVNTAAQTRYNLPATHAYTILSAHELKDTAGNVVQRLYRVRNPWGTDNYDGPWADNSNLWTAAYKA